MKRERVAVDRRRDAVPLEKAREASASMIAVQARPREKKNPRRTVTIPRLNADDTPFSLFNKRDRRDAAGRSRTPVERVRSLALHFGHTPLQPVKGTAMNLPLSTRVVLVFLLLVPILTTMPAVAVEPALAHLAAAEEGYPQLSESEARATPGAERPDRAARKAKKAAKKAQRNATGEEAESEDETWSVDQPAEQPGHQVEIDTTSGTWMNLDVSPDGREIVFDLLGDLYLLPIEGGEARNLTSGMAWDMQPRFSPDGSRIAFTSDRAGGDNIWIINRDGSDARQVTEESFRLLNSPAWSPDGDYIIARKHFTARRSLGAGEIWLYHHTGGDGVQLTEKPNEQKDAGEPVFSPDGRYVYYSQDTTPGPLFEYNKDPNTQIYVTQRIDLEKGKEEVFLDGPGGAIRPTPSPDGKLLAFVRRVRYKSTLFVHQIETGRQWPVYDGLERDMQETWAIHGVYPTMAWMPDGGSIVLWAGGEIRRIDIANKSAATIPFHVADHRRVLEVVRYRHPVAPDEFDLKMLRWVQVSPTGDQLLFQALGKIWLRDLPNGEARRLTGQNDHFELYPSFSRDGRSIVYVSWDDEELGAVRVADAGGGEGRKVTSKPGHYLEPVLSPDGQSIAYRRIGGGFLRSPTYSRDQGVYLIPSAGGSERLVTEEGINPHFGARSDRLFLTTFPGEGKRVLKSVELSANGDERSWFTSDNATEMRVSPDGKWIAFTERFNAYVEPFVRGSKPLALGPKASAVPLTRVSKDAGEYIHWSGDSQALHWVLGPELFTRKLSEAFAFVDGAPEELPEPAAAGTAIGFSAEADLPKGSVIALIGARLVTMKGDEVIDNGTVVVRDNRIAAIGPAAEVAIPEGATTIRVDGKTITPGLVDVHWHGAFGTAEIVPEENWMNYASLAFGVTTIHDPSNDTSTTFAASEMQRAGAIVGPRIYSTGTILYGAKAPFKAVIDSLDDARSHLRRMKAVGAISVKSYNQPRRDQRQQVIAAARELEMMVVPEGGSLFQHNMTMVVDGHTGIEHSIPVPAIYDDVLQLWSGTEVGYTPTLVVGYGGMWGENYWYATTDVWANERLLSFVPREFVDPRARRQIHVPDEEWNHFDNARVARKLHDAGVGVQIGAHGQREGLGAHWELWMLEQGGMTAHEALRAATLEGAQYLGLDGDIGSLEVGKLADLIVIDGNPLEDLRTSENVDYTMLNGRLYDAATMNEVAPRKRERGKFWWED